jgi:hypothetical protein
LLLLHYFELGSMFLPRAGLDPDPST